MIVRAKRNTNFTIISNVGMNDERLSFKARGILAYLLTKPDHWQVSDRHLATVGPDGRSAVQAALKELEIAGYLRRDKYQDKQGKWVWRSTIYDEPWPDYPATDYPATDKPSTDYPATDNQAKVSTEVVKTEVVKTEQSKDGGSHHAHGKNPATAHGGETTPHAAVFAAYMDNISATIAPIVSEQLGNLVDEIGARPVIHGITVAAENNKRSYRYVETVARNNANGTEPTYRNGAGTSKVERSMAAVDRVAARLAEQESK